MNKHLAIFTIAFLLISCNAYKLQPSSQQAQSSEGMVSAAHPLAMQAGKRILEKGGNAVDAAVAAAFTLAVVEPSMSGLGGRLQAIVRMPNGEIKGVDATTQIPSDFDYETAPKGRDGYPVIGIPGVVAGLCKLNAQYGSLPLKTVMAPAIHYAHKGFALLPGEARRHSLAKERLEAFEGSRQYFLKADGSTYQAGDWWVQKDLANTLKQIATEGKGAFYTGKIAEAIVADNQKNGGVLSLRALAEYEARDALIVNGNYRDHGLHGLWMPSFGAITIQILQILENLPMDSYDEAEWASAVGQAIAIAYEHRAQQKLSDSMAQVLVDPTYTQKLSQRIDVEGTLKKVGFQPNEAEAWHASLGHTTHLTTADGSGMMVALTQSLGPNMGSKVAAPGLGFLFATTIGQYLRMTEPGQRASSHISPFLITQEGKPFLALGAAGGSRIVTAIAAVCSRVIDQGLSLEKALEAPRVYPDVDTLMVEVHPGLSWTDETLDKLESFGHYLERIDQPGRFGRVHAIQFDVKLNQWIGAADPDWEGAAGGPEK